MIHAQKLNRFKQVLWVDLKRRPKYITQRYTACQEKSSSCTSESKEASELYVQTPSSESVHGQDDRWCIQFRITFCWMCTANPEKSNNKERIKISNIIILKLLINRVCWKIKMRHSQIQILENTLVKFTIGKNWTCFLSLRLDWLSIVSWQPWSCCSAPCSKTWHVSMPLSEESLL